MNMFSQIDWESVLVPSLNADESVAKRSKKTAANKRRRQIWLGVAVLLTLFAAAGAWKWTPLADQIDIRKITIWVYSIRDNPALSQSLTEPELPLAAQSID